MTTAQLTLNLTKCSSLDVVSTLESIWQFIKKRSIEIWNLGKGFVEAMLEESEFEKQKTRYMHLRRDIF